MTERKPQYYKYLIKMVGMCEICRVTENLEVHHINRLSNGGYERPRNIQIVCKECHKFIHSGEFR